ncbi:MAG: hypothetical protein N2067_05970 [Spirochaetaceae bacterium]|nr:hypothetical protein [Spirochaetaceae bacterium]
MVCRKTGSGILIALSVSLLFLGIMTSCPLWPPWGTLTIMPEAQWVRTLSTGESNSEFRGLAIDRQGNIYAAGCQYGYSTYTYGPGVSATGTASGANAVLVKYDSNGIALWARTLYAGALAAWFMNVAVDGTGAVYAVGFQYGSGAYSYGPGVSVAGPSAAWNAVLVKYDAQGNALWARSAVSGTGDSEFDGVAIDGSNHVYVAGYQSGTEVMSYGPGVTAAGTADYANVLLVRYDSDGNAQWARTQTAGTEAAWFTDVAVDRQGAVYAVGAQKGTGTYAFGNGVSVAGPCAYNSVLIVKYSSSGDAIWARSTLASTKDSMFHGIALDRTGNIYAVGAQKATGTYTYGTDVSATGTASGDNAMIVKYSPAGKTLWARTLTEGSNTSWFFDVATDSRGNVYAAGFQAGSGTYGYGDGVSATGTSSSSNVIMVKYSSLGRACGARTATGGSLTTFYRSVAVDSLNRVYAAGYQNGTEAHFYGTDVSASGSSIYENAMLVMYR